MSEEAEEVIRQILVEIIKAVLSPKPLDGNQIAKLEALKRILTENDDAAI